MSTTAIVEYFDSGNYPMVACNASDNPYELHFVPWRGIQHQTTELTHNLAFQPRLLRSHTFSSIFIASNGLCAELLSLVTLVVLSHV